MLLESHLQAGSIINWSPGSRKILEAKKFITSLIEEKLNIVIDAPSVQGGTSSTGNVVRRCLKRVNDTKKDFLYWLLSLIPIQSHPNVTLYGCLCETYNLERSHYQIISMCCE